VVQRLTVALVRPLRALVAQRRVEPDCVQRAFDVVGVVTLLQQREGHAPRAPPRLREGRFGELGFGPFRVRQLQVAREPTQVPGVHRWDVAAHGHGVGERVLAGEVELGETVEGAQERRAAAVALAEPEGVRSVAHGELDALRIPVEAVGEMAQEEERGGSDPVIRYSSTMKRRIAVYCRISLDRTEESESPARQEAECRRMVEAKGWDVAEVFTDRDRSAFSKTALRPDYDRMMEGVRRGEFDGVAVWKLDRLTRRFIQIGKILETLEDANAVLLSVVDSIDTTTAMGQAIVGFVIAQAQQESENTSVRVKAAAREAARNGRASPGGSRCFGYTSEMEIVPAEAKVAREMADRVLGGESFRSIAFDLNVRGIVGTNGNPWSAPRVAQYLRSATPAGLRVLDGDEIEGAWERILTPDERLVILQSRRSGGRSGKPKALLAGRIFCTCGGRMKTMGFRMHNGKTFPRYQCVKTPGRTNCGKVAASLVAVEKVVRGEFLDFLSRSELRPLPDERKVEELQTLVDADLAALVDLTKARFVERSISPEEYDAAHSALQARVDANSKTLDAWTRDETDRAGALRPGSREALEAWWDSASPDDRRVAIGFAVRSVVIHPAKRRGGNVFDTDRVKIGWSYAFYLRAAEAWQATATSEDIERAEEEFARLNREALV
jgi:site-specific DNA recombinase